ncbi:MAG: ATP-binding protein, partial [Bacillota bacterium]|nr:ATP-binding protein [Bacillota bacterium]
MFSRVHSLVSIGYRTHPIVIETHITKGLPYYTVVGLPSAVVRESKERVRSALKFSGEVYPSDHITQSLFPAYEKKEGSQLDLPLAVGIFSALHSIDVGSVIFLGELSLDGKIKSTRKLIHYIVSAPENTVFVLPRECEKEVASFGFKIKPFYYEDVKDLFQDLKNHIFIDCRDLSDGFMQYEEAKKLPDFSEVRGQNRAIRDLQIAAIGSFHTLIMGPPGCGKTMIANRFSGILPAPNQSENIEISRIYGNRMINRRPVRTPHHSITKTALAGGCKMGEISKAHHGVLVLDEFGEYSKNTLETLREPLETGEIHISRAHDSMKFPAKFILVATMNPCFCGRFSRYHHDCSCERNALLKYYSRLSWPLIDRMGVYIELEKVDLDMPYSKSSAELRTEVEEAIAFGRRYDAENRYSYEFAEDIKRIYENREITLRSLNCVKRVAASIANLEKSVAITRE